MAFLRVEAGSIYDGVANPGLKRKLEEVELVLQGLSWPLNTELGKIELGFTRAVGLSTTDLWLLSDALRYGVVDTTDQDGIPRIDLNGGRVFAAICFVVGESHKRKIYGFINLAKSERPNFPWQETVNQARLELGTHPLAEAIHDPDLFLRAPKPRSPRVKGQNGFGEQSEVDFSTGSFWTEPLGAAVKDFARSCGWNREQQLSTIQAASALQLSGSDRQARVLIVNLIRGGAIRVPKEGTRYQLNVEQALLAGLELLYLDRGYSAWSIEENLGLSIKGSCLESHFGDLSRLSLTGNGHTFFSPQSRWLGFPLEAAPKPEQTAIENRLPTFTRRELAELKTVDIQALRDLEAKIPPGSIETVNPNRHASYPIQRAVMLIYSAAKRCLRLYDPKEDYELRVFYQGLKACEAAFQEERIQKANITNLEQLVRLVVGIIETPKYKALYWGKSTGKDKMI